MRGQRGIVQALLGAALARHRRAPVGEEDRAALRTLLEPAGVDRDRERRIPVDRHAGFGERNRRRDQRAPRQTAEPLGRKAEARDRAGNADQLAAR